MRHFCKFWLLFPLVALFGLTTARAETSPPLPLPKGEVILTIEGEITHRNTPTGYAFDLEMLQALGEVTFTTSSPWSLEPQTYRGTPLHLILEAAGVTGVQMSAVATNEYAVQVPVSDAVEGGPIVAWEREGKLMTLRDRGPLWLIYPFDDKPEYKVEVIYSRSIWQLHTLRVHKP